MAVAGLSRGDADPLDLTDEQLRADAGVLDGVQLIGTGIADLAAVGRPALSVVGIDAPAVDGAGMVLVPSARARLALRIGPGDDAAAARDALVAHLEAHAPWGARSRVTAGEPVAPYSARHLGSGVRRGPGGVRGGLGHCRRSRSASAARSGSSRRSPRRFPEAEVLITGVEDPDTRAHAANESLHLADFERACLAEALLLRPARPVEPGAP